MRLVSALLALLLVLTASAPAEAHGCGVGVFTQPGQVIIQRDQFGRQFRVVTLSNGQVIAEPLNGLFLSQSGFAQVGSTVIFRSGVFPFVPTHSFGSSRLFFVR